MKVAEKIYLALGDSMSIDDYTGVPGGGAVNQFFRTLGEGWRLADHTFDGCQMGDVPRTLRGDLITLTIGGNDLLCHRDRYLSEGLESLAAEHRSLLVSIRSANPNAVFVVGDIYGPSEPLSEVERQALDVANRAIRQNCAEVDARLAPIREAFQGREQRYLCLAIEPTLAGAKAIADLFRRATAGKIET